MMNTDEINKSIRRLNALLPEVGLDWVLNEVSGVVDKGVEEIKEVSMANFAADDEEDSLDQMRRGRKIKATTTRPFTEAEELLLLIDAIQEAAIAASQMRENALLNLKTPDLLNPVVQFRADTPEGFEEKGYALSDSDRGVPFEVALADEVDRSALLPKLQHLLTTLRRDTDANK